MLSGVSTGFMGSKYTRLLKQGEAGHTVAMVELSWIESPCGSSSRCMRLRMPPYFGVSARAEWTRPVVIARTMKIHRLRFMSVSSRVCRSAVPAPLPLDRSHREPLHHLTLEDDAEEHITLEDDAEEHSWGRRQETGGGDERVVDVGLAHQARPQSLSHRSRVGWRQLPGSKSRFSSRGLAPHSIKSCNR